MKTKTDEKILKAKAYIEKLPKLKLKGLVKAKEKTPQSFLKVFFSNYNKKLETVYCSNGSIQCMPGKRRSISDIYLIVRHYYPKASLTKLYIELLKLISENHIVSSLCKDIKKRVYRGVNTGGEKGFLNGTLIDEFQIDLKTFKYEDVKLTTICSHNKEGWGASYTKNDIEMIEL